MIQFSRWDGILERLSLERLDNGMIHAEEKSLDKMIGIDGRNRKKNDNRKIEGMEQKT